MPASSSLAFRADRRYGADFAVTDAAWLAGSGSPVDIRFSVGLDGLGVWLFGLSALLFVTAVLVSWEAIDDRAPLFYAMLLLLEFGCLGVFAARDIILFYVFFEFTLIPLFFLIGIWGSEERRLRGDQVLPVHAGRQHAHVPGPPGASCSGTTRHNGEHTLRFSIPALTQRPGRSIRCRSNWQLVDLPGPLRRLRDQGAAVSAAHLAAAGARAGADGGQRHPGRHPAENRRLWLPAIQPADAARSDRRLHALRCCGSASPASSMGRWWRSPRRDIKKLIAYSSVSHLGYCMLGLFALNATGVQGSVLQMVNHGLSTGGLFAMVGMLYERYHTRQIADLSGLAAPHALAGVLHGAVHVLQHRRAGPQRLRRRVPDPARHVPAGLGRCAAAARRRSSSPIAVLAVSGVVLGAWYMLWLVQRVFFGPLKEPHDATTHEVHDLSLREILALAPLAVFVVWIGIRPGDFLSRMQPTLEAGPRSRRLAALDEH